MSKDFKPKAGQITLSSVIGRGILHELECSDTGSLTVPDIEEPCEIGLYSVTLTSASSRTERAVLCGRTESGNVLDEDACKEILSLPVQDSTQEGHSAPHWLKHGAAPMFWMNWYPFSSCWQLRWISCPQPRRTRWSE